MCGCQCKSSPWVWIAATMPGTTSSRPSRRRTSAWMHVQAHEQSLPSSLRSKRVCSRRRLGMVSTTCRWATAAQTSSAT